MSYSFLETPVEYLKGVGPKRAELLNRELQIFSFNDLITYFPFRYVDISRIFKTTEINSDLTYVQLKGKIRDINFIGKGKARRLQAYLYDDTGRIELLWFKGFRWIKDKFHPDKEYIVFGKPSLFNNKFNIPHPEIEEASSQDTSLGENFQAVYSSTERLKSKGLGSKGINKIMRNLIKKVDNNIPENLSNELLDKYNLMRRETSLRTIHFPPDQHKLKKAHIRLKFEELFFIQVKLLKQKFNRIKKYKGHLFPEVGSYFNTFYHHHLPFKLTEDQKKVIKEIRADLGSGKQMNRLLQGDVGSGKTLVGLMIMLLALDNDYQTCFMAPTEILASQHFQTFKEMLGKMNVTINLLTGSTKPNERKEIFKNLRENVLQILIGTHALIEETVIFNKLGLAIIDEQHRFGVAQRAKLWKKSKTPPHVLVMTATPIPRTLAMTLYGDLDFSVIKQLPPGRKPVKTYHYYDKDRLKLFGFLKKQIRQGRQIYIVYPLIQESQKLDLKDLMDGYESISRAFPSPEYSISILHGQMKAENKDYEMQRFVQDKTQILVSTTVIEVGVDVSNATVMVIENAERFGLSQLHQLRGRVGRGAEQAYCILMTKNKISNEARKRIETMVKTNDGFEIAETDLNLRGPGELEGTKQSGIINLKIANLIKDEKILKSARNNALQMLEEDQELKMNKNRPVLEFIKFMNRYSTNWCMIS